MVRVSIFSLIYQSPDWADFVYESIHKNTPMISRGDAEFFFVANDATDEVLDHLDLKGYPHYVLVNKRITEEELFAMGYAKPEYLSRVYKGFNFGIERSKGDVVVIINSDMAFSPDWLENLLRCLTPKSIVTSQLVERDHPKFGIFPGVYHGEFGCSISDFKEDDFLDFVLRQKATGLIPGKGYSPCAFYKTPVFKAGLFPEGNIAGRTYNEVIECGDERLFRALSKMGVRHYTVLDSIVYHFKEGEMTSTPSSRTIPRFVPQPDYFPLKPIFVEDGKIVLNDGSEAAIAIRRIRMRLQRVIRRFKVRLWIVKEKALGRM